MLAVSPSTSTGPAWRRESRRELLASSQQSRLSLQLTLLSTWHQHPAVVTMYLLREEIVGVAHREVFEYPLDATTKALKIALRRRAILKKLERGEGSQNLSVAG